MAWVLISSLSAAGQAAARREKRVVGDRAYGTKAEAAAARAARGGGGRGRGGRAGGVRRGGSGGVGQSVTAGWVSEVVVHTAAFTVASATHTECVNILGEARTGADVMDDGVPMEHCKVLGVRLELKTPFEAVKLAWAAAVVTNVPTAAHLPGAVAAIAGAKAGHDASVDAWFTLGLAGMETLTTPEAKKTLNVYVSFQNQVVTGGTAQIVYKLHVTVLKPKAAVAVHTLT